MALSKGNIIGIATIGAALVGAPVACEVKENLDLNASRERVIDLMPEGHRDSHAFTASGAAEAIDAGIPCSNGVGMRLREGLELGLGDGSLSPSEIDRIWDEDCRKEIESRRLVIENLLAGNEDELRAQLRVLPSHWETETVDVVDQIKDLNMKIGRLPDEDHQALGLENPLADELVGTSSDYKRMAFDYRNGWRDEDVNPYKRAADIATKHGWITDDELYKDMLTAVGYEVRDQEVCANDHPDGARALRCVRIARTICNMSASIHQARRAAGAEVVDIQCGSFSYDGNTYSDITDPSKIASAFGDK